MPIKFAWKNKNQIELFEKGYWKHLHKRRKEIILEEINKFQHKHNKKLLCLDLGCGDGLFLKILSNQGVECVGSDIDIERLKKAKIYTPKNKIVNSEIGLIPFKDKTFDIVLLHHVLEHIDNDTALLIACKKLLKDDGILILGIPNEDNINGRLSRLIQPSLYNKGEHIHFYSQKNIINILENSGFTIQDIKHIGFLHPIYPLHVLLTSWNFSFVIGNFLTQLLKFSADSLLVICSKN